METVWTFRTQRHIVALEVGAEDEDPADHFTDDEAVADIERGAVLWFVARVSIYKNTHRVGADVLGKCAYASIEEFCTGHRDPDPMNRNCSPMRAARGNNLVICHYFPDMVRQAIADARQTLAH